MGRRANGEGTIFQRKDGRWVGETFVLLPNGGRDRRTVYGRSRAEVHGKITQLARQAQVGIVAPDAKITVGGYLDYWLAEVAARKVRPSTFRAYSLMVRRHLKPALGTKKLERLGAADVRRLMNEKLDSGLAFNSVRQIHAVLRAALEQAVRDDLIVRNVAKLVPVGAPQLSEVRPYSPAEASHLLDAAVSDRLHALWAVALSIGLRKGEALGLQWDDVDLEGGWVHIRQSLQRADGRLQLLPTKTKRSERTVPLPEACLPILREHWARQAAERLAMGESWTDHGLVFCTLGGTPIEPGRINRAFNELCDRAGVRRIRVHDLRHTCATLLLAQGVPARVVMEILGHSQIAVTMNIYTHVAPELQREAMAKMDGLFGAVAVKTAVNADPVAAARRSRPQKKGR